MLKIIKTSLTEKNFEEYEKLSMQTKYGVNLHPSWLRAYIDHFGYKGKELFLELRDSNSNDLKGLLPMVVQEQKDTRFIKLKRLIPCGYRPTDFFPFLIVRGYEKECIDKIAYWFYDNHKDWDHLMVNLIPDDKVWPYLVKKLTNLSFKVDISDEKNYLIIDTNGSYDEYFKSLGSKKRYNIRKKIEFIKNSLGNIKYDHIENGLISYFDKFLELSNERKKVKQQSNPFTRVKELEPFFRKIIIEYEKLKKIRLQIIYNNDEIIGLKYYLISNKIVYDLLTTFSNKFAKYSIGQLAYYDIIKKCFDHKNVDEFNFMRSIYPQKLWWQPKREPYVAISVENNKSIKNKINSVFLFLSKLKRIILNRRFNSNKFP